MRLVRNGGDSMSDSSERREQPSRRCKRLPRELEAELGTLWERVSAEPSPWCEAETRKEKQYWKRLRLNERREFTNDWKRLQGKETQLPPYKYRLLRLPEAMEAAKLAGLQQLEQLKQSSDPSECAKVRQWLDGLLRIPFGKLASHHVPPPRSVAHTWRTWRRR